MDSLQISYFLKVAETEHMTNAAKELHVSQPALSRSLRTLEEELGVKLFDRLGRRLVLNENGKRFYATAIQFERGIYGLKHTPQTNRKLSGSLTVQVRVDNLAVLEAVADFCRHYPSIRVTAVTHSNVNPSDLQWDFLLDGVNPLFTQLNPDCVPLFEEPYLLAVPEEQPLFSSSVVSLAEAKEIPFVLPTREQELSGIIVSYCREAGFQPICRMETNSYLVMLSMVSEGGCVALVPKMAPAVSNYPHVRLLMLKEQAFLRAIVLREAEDGTRSEVRKAFRSFMTQKLEAVF